MTLRKYAILFAILTTGISGCCTTKVEPALPCPDRPDLLAIPEDLLMAADPDLLFIVAENQGLLRAYAKKLENRACPGGT